MQPEPAIEEVNDGWAGTKLVRLQRANPRAVRVVDAALSVELASDVYSHTIECGRSWGTYVTLQEAQDGSLLDDAERGLAARMVREVWLRGAASQELLAPELHRVHGFALWVNAASQGEACEYHLDYAEMYRRRRGILHPPILASTVHVTDFDSSGGGMVGGEFGVNTGGLEHYLRFGHHGIHVRSEPGAMGRDWEHGDGWHKAEYRFRRAILFDGELPHCSAPVVSLPDASLRRVVVGINVFDVEVGPHAMVEPVHSEAYRAAMAQLQSFKRVPPSEQGVGPRYSMVPLEGGENGNTAAAACARCGKQPAPLGGRGVDGGWFCGAKCLKAAHRERALATRDEASATAASGSALADQAGAPPPPEEACTLQTVLDVEDLCDRVLAWIRPRELLLPPVSRGFLAVTRSDAYWCGWVEHLLARAEPYRTPEMMLIYQFIADQRTALLGENFQLTEEWWLKGNYLFDAPTAGLPQSKWRHGVVASPQPDYVFKPPLVVSRFDICFQEEPMASLAGRGGGAAPSREVYKAMLLLRNVHGAPGPRTIGWGDEGDGEWLPLIVPWDEGEELAPLRLLERLGAHPQLRRADAIRLVESVVDEDEDDDARAYHRMSSTAQELVRWRAESSGGALRWQRAPSFRTALRALLSQHRSAVFHCGLGELNPVPCFAVARVRPDLVVGFVGGVVRWSSRFGAGVGAAAAAAAEPGLGVVPSVD